MTELKYLSHQGKIRLQGKEAKEGVALELEISALSDLGQWSHYLPSVGGDPRGKYLDLQTQKSVWPEKSVYGEN